MRKRKKSSLSSLRVHHKDTLEEASDKNDKLIKMVQEYHNRVRELESQNKTIEAAWKKTEGFLIEVTEGRPLAEVLEDVESKRPLRKLRRACPECSDRKMKKIQFDGFHVVVCSKCSYRNRVDERPS